MTEWCSPSSWKYGLALVGTFTFSVVVGYCAARRVVKYLHRRIYKVAELTPPDFDMNRPHILDWFVGGIERSTATYLMIFVPTLLAPFVGGWMALKLAANWQRRTPRGDPTLLNRQTLAALVGSGLSFGIAIGCGIAFRWFACGLGMPAFN